MGSPARAAVTSNALDDVWPLDNPFTTGIDEGLPDGGNTINPSLAPNAMAQTNFEGEQTVIVGRTENGTLIINGGSDLRYQDLIIGGYDPGAASTEGGPPSPGSFSRGSGTVRIEGGGSLYNNNYNLLPPSIGPDNPFGIVWGTATRAANDTDGFDLYVGRQFDGLLRLSLGGRVEIQDAVVIGDSGATGTSVGQSQSVGRIDVDGFESTFISGGFVPPNPNDNLPHQMVVGRLGTGMLNITNGGRVINLGPLLTPGEDIIGAVIGSDAFDGTGAPQTSGSGTATVDGVGSTWTVGGTLQVGGFHNALDLTGPSPSEEDLEGNDVNYTNEGHFDTLIVRNSGLVSIISPFSDPMAQVPDRIDFVVGWSGRVQLLDGTIELLGVLQQNTPGGQVTQELDQGRLINDGVISGSGSITTLQFRNRVLGEVSVSAGEKLSISASGEFPEPDPVVIPVPGPPDYPLLNYGLIDVLGTETARAEIEFMRQTGTPPMPGDPLQVRPLLNLPVSGPAGANGRTEGLIHGEHSIMRFRTGLHNRGVLAFTAGDNVVSGDVISFADSAPGADDHGRVVFGPDTNVAFEDDFVSLGTTQFSPGATIQVLKGNSLVLGGLTKMSIPGGPFGFDFIPSLVSGNATFGGVLELTISNGALLPPLSSTPLFDVGGTIFGNFADVVVIGSPLEFFTAVQGSFLILQAFDPAFAVGADFNGDGSVDTLDYAIWKQHYGETGPVGDANGDMMVDALDYTVWRNTATPGAGSGGLGGVGAVPEPSSMLLLVCGAMLALAGRRKR